MNNQHKSIKHIMDSRLSNLTIHHELKQQVLSKDRVVHKQTKKGHIRRRPATIGIVLLICILLAVPVMGSHLPILNLLMSYAYDPYIQYIQPIERTSEDQGIKMNVLASYHDGETAIVYLTLQDLSEERIDETLDLYNYSINGAGHNVFTYNIVNYDEASRTATIRMIANGGDAKSGRKVNVRISSFLSHKKKYEQVNMNRALAHIPGGKADTTKLDLNNIPGAGGAIWELEEQSSIIDILVLNQKSISIPGIDFVHISNVGYVNDRLHVQTIWDESVDNHGYIYTVVPKKGQIHPTYSLSFGADQQGNTNYGDNYIEYIFDISSEELSGASWYGYFVENGMYTEGNWETTFRLEPVGDEVITITDPTLKTLDIEKLTISPIGISAYGDFDSSEQLEIEVTTVDGNLVAYNHTIAVKMDGEKNSVKWIPELPMPFEQIQELRVNGILVDLE